MFQNQMEGLFLVQIHGVTNRSGSSAPDTSTQRIFLSVVLYLDCIVLAVN